jgi:hypothetical protein
MAEADDARRALRRALAPRLAQLGAPLEVVAEDVLGEADGVIDWVAAGPDGRATLVLVADGAGDAALLQAALVQRAWVAARIADWRKLAPGLALRAELAPRVLLIARNFTRATQIATREAAGTEIVLARWSAAPGTGHIELERVDGEGAVARESVPAPARRAMSPFRTSLSDTDFAN